MARVDAGLIAAALTEQFRVLVAPSVVLTDGGEWPALRPVSLVEPSGFAIVLSAAMRSIVADFTPDRFAAPLLNAMAAADDEARGACIARIRAATEQGINVRISLDERPLCAPDDILSLWSRFDLSCDRHVRASRDLTEAEAVAVASACFGIVLALLPLEEDDEPSGQAQGLPEGAKLSVVVNRYERSKVNRSACLAHHGYACAACGFEFGKRYGAIGDGFIHVHHITPVSQMGGTYRIDPIRDLVPLCANCHAMVHREDPPLTVAALRDLLQALPPI